MCINNNNAVINNNYGRLPRPYFSLQNFHGLLKEFLQNL